MGVVRALAHGLVLGLAVMSACAGGSMTSSATATDSSTTTASSMSTGAIETDGLSSTSAASSTSTSTAATFETDGPTDPTTTTGNECPTPETYQCDIWAQDDCCAGEKCNPWAMDGGSAWVWTRCSPIESDPDQVGEPCTVVDSPVSGIDSCEKGAMCWSVDPETNSGICVALCKGSEYRCSVDPWSCCPDVHACTIGAHGALILCLEFCDPLLQNCLDEGEVCYPNGNRFECLPDNSGGKGAVGEPCEFINACAPGSFCADPKYYPGCDLNAAGCCVPFCRLDMPECGPGTECLPWYDPMDVPPGYENLGACVIPP